MRGVRAVDALRGPGGGAGRLVAGLVGALALSLLVTGCSEEEPYADYCALVEEHRDVLSEAVAAGGPDALISVLPRLAELRDEAPGDVADDWQQVVGRIGALADALEAAGVDPATYDRSDPPGGVGRAERTAIDAAARELARPETREALVAVETQVRDVCGTPLYRT